MRGEGTPGAVTVAADQHARDLAVISRALQVTSGQRRAALLAQLRPAAFLLAHTAGQPDFAYRAPAECYWPDEDLEYYFQPCPDGWFLHNRYAEHRRELTELGVADQVRVTARTGNSSGHIVLRDAWGEHRRGLNGFDPDLHISGLDAALANPDPRRSVYVWNRLLAPRADRLRGTVEFASRQEYINSERREQDTQPHRIAATRAWLPTPDGGYATPRELTIDELPPDFIRHNGLADTLGMITSAVQQASTELGIPLNLLLYLADHPDALAEVSRAAAKALSAPGPPPGMPEAPASPVDFAARLQDAFTKLAEHSDEDEDNDSFRRHGQVGAPTMRRGRTAAAIKDAQAAEPAPHERFHFLPRKVWDDKNPDVRQFLLEQYAGRCQICTATFPKRDGNPYFEILYLISHTSAAWIDRPGDVLCLCPTCTSKFLHGDVHADDVLDQIRSWRTRTEGGAAPVLHLTLCEEPTVINYTEKHLLDLQTMLTLGVAPS